MPASLNKDNITALSCESISFHGVADAFSWNGRNLAANKFLKAIFILMAPTIKYSAIGVILSISFIIG